MVCLTCGELKQINKKNFRIRRDKGVESFRKMCKACEGKQTLLWRRNNTKRAMITQQEWRKKNKQYKANYVEANKEKLKNYRREYERRPNIRIKKHITGIIRREINKNGNPVMKYLQYTICELKQHLESLFCDWMTWENWGKYDPQTWNDTDKSTWVWNIDHIIPHSTFVYNSMEDDEFNKCWAMSNLRPYSAKQNILDGAKRTRHSK